MSGPAHDVLPRAQPGRTARRRIATIVGSWAPAVKRVADFGRTWVHTPRYPGATTGFIRQFSRASPGTVTAPARPATPTRHNGDGANVRVASVQSRHRA